MVKVNFDTADMQSEHEQIKSFLIKSGVDNKEEIFDFIDHGKSLSITKGDYLIRESQTCKNLYFLHQGAISIFVLNQGTEHVKDFSLDNKFITSYSSFLKGTPSQLYLRAEQDCILTKWDKTYLDSLTNGHKCWISFAKNMSDYLFMRKEEREISLLIYSAEQRYLDFLKHYPEAFQAFPQYSIASYLGIRPQSLSRIRKALSSK